MIFGSASDEVSIQNINNRCLITDWLLRSTEVFSVLFVDYWLLLLYVCPIFDFPPTVTTTTRTFTTFCPDQLDGGITALLPAFYFWLCLVLTEWAKASRIVGSTGLQSLQWQRWRGQEVAQWETEARQPAVGTYQHASACRRTGWLERHLLCWRQWPEGAADCKWSVESQIFSFLLFSWAPDWQLSGLTTDLCHYCTDCDSTFWLQTCKPSSFTSMFNTLLLCHTRYWGFHKHFMTKVA